MTTSLTILQEFKKTLQSSAMKTDKKQEKHITIQTQIQKQSPDKNKDRTPTTIHKRAVMR